MNNVVKQAILDEYELYCIFLGDSQYDEKKIAYSLGFTAADGIYKEKYIKNNEPWILEYQKLINPYNNGSYYAIFTFFKKESTDIQLYFLDGNDNLSYIISKYHSEDDIIEYTKCNLDDGIIDYTKYNSSQNYVCDLVKLKNIEDLKNIGFIKNTKIPKYTLIPSPKGYIYEKNHKLYFIKNIRSDIYEIAEVKVNL